MGKLRVRRGKPKAALGVCTSCGKRPGMPTLTPGSPAGKCRIVCAKCKRVLGPKDPHCPCCNELVAFTRSGDWKCSKCNCDGDPCFVVWK